MCVYVNDYYLRNHWEHFFVISIFFLCSSDFKIHIAFSSFLLTHSSAIFILLLSLCSALFLFQILYFSVLEFPFILFFIVFISLLRFLMHFLIMAISSFKHLNIFIIGVLKFPSSNSIL